MRFKGQRTPMTPAERKRKSRAMKRGTWVNTQKVEVPQPPGVPGPMRPHLTLPAPLKQTPAPALPAPANSTPAQPALPAPPSTAIQKSLPSDSNSLALFGGEASGDAPRFCLPPAVAARLRSLLDKHKAGKHLTAAERAEAEGLLDIAEYF